MLSFVQGTIDHIENDYIIVNVHNTFGLQIYTPKQTIKNKKNGEKIKLYTFLSIKESGAELYGFETKKELDIFMQFTTIKNIGPKTALSILSSSSIDNIIHAIDNDDSSFFASIRGIGPKAAKRLILELKDKLISKQEENHELQDALISLGISKKDVKSLIQNLIKQKGFSKKSLQEQIKIALKFMSKND